MLTSCVRITNSAFTLYLLYLVTNTFPHLQRGTYSSISTFGGHIFPSLLQQIAYFPAFANFSVLFSAIASGWILTSVENDSHAPALAAVYVLLSITRFVSYF